MDPKEIKEENAKRRKLAKLQPNASHKRTKLIKDPNAPKRPRSAYVRFYLENRTAGQTIAVGAREASSRWKAMSASEKKVNLNISHPFY